MTFPENFIRGIPNSTYLNDGGSVGSLLFYFQGPAVNGNRENSINWEDDNSVIEFTLAQTKDDGTLHFKAGAVVIPTEEIERLSKRPTISSLLSYERKPLSDNPYHGNLLLSDTTSKANMKLIAAGLALAVTKIIVSKRK